MIFSNDWFINIICSLVLSLSIFISLKYQKQTSGGCSRELACDFMNANVIYFLRTGVGMRIEKSIFQCVPTALYMRCARYYWLSMSYVRYASGGEGPKMINQYQCVTHCVVCVALDTPLSDVRQLRKHVPVTSQWRIQKSDYVYAHFRDNE